MSSIGDRIMYLRKNANLTQQELGENTFIHRGNISNYEHDKVVPGADVVVVLAGYFKVSCDWLLTGKDFVPPPGYTSDLSSHYLKEKPDEYSTSSEQKIKHDFTEEELILIDCYRLLKREQQLRFLGRIEGATDNF